MHFRPVERKTVPALALALAFLAASGWHARADAPAVGAAPEPDGGETAAPAYSRPPSSWLDAQIALDRRSFSCGSIDGIGGPNSAAALRAFQESEKLPLTGELDSVTGDRLRLTAPPLQQISLGQGDLRRIHPLPPTWLGKSQETALDYESALELTAERYHSHPSLLRRLNPVVDWDHLTPESVLTVPNVTRRALSGKAALLRIFLAEHILQIRDPDGALMAQFPVSIARKAEKRPEGLLHVTLIAPHPDYTFDPDLFPESPEGRQIGHKLLLPPGPNNPVGDAWIGLDRPGYGIHGTPNPEKIGRTESHGCFRLTNWDALALVDLAWPGLPVDVEP